ncbi:MAG: TOBE domain-containing protein [Deltaproteobacteria bacterium]|nr:TOBE domain-containing protein [Deltaproteobacteria bacterium]
MNAKTKEHPASSAQQPPIQKNTNHGRIVSIPDEDQCLDAVQLHRLEHSFREWAESSPRADVRLSRRRIVLIFLLIRYTGAKLNEVLSLNPFGDIDTKRQCILFRRADLMSETNPREVQISEDLSGEIQRTLDDPAFRNPLQSRFGVDPGFVRRKFYERAQACGYPKRLGSPELIRKARAVEMMQGNMPLPVVQMMLGHSTPNLTSSYVSFSEDEIQQVTRLFLEREASRKTSARNAFFGKILTIHRGDIQACVNLTTMSGHSVTTVITIDSLNRLALKEGGLIRAEVKAPWVILEQGDKEPACSAENRFHGRIVRIAGGEVNTEYAVRISDGTELCALVSTAGSRQLNLNVGDPVWALFNSFAVVLHID